MGGRAGVYYMYTYIYTVAWTISIHIYLFCTEIPEPVAPVELQELIATDNTVLEQLLDESRKMQVHACK